MKTLKQQLRSGTGTPPECRRHVGSLGGEPVRRQQDRPRRDTR